MSVNENGNNGVSVEAHMAAMDKCQCCRWWMGRVGWISPEAECTRNAPVCLDVVEVEHKKIGVGYHPVTSRDASCGEFKLAESYPPVADESSRRLTVTAKDHDVCSLEDIERIQHYTPPKRPKRGYIIPEAIEKRIAVIEEKIKPKCTCIGGHGWWNNAHCMIHGSGKAGK